MAVLQEYKCPCCGGAIAFDSSLQNMKCPYCDTEFEMETLASYDHELKNEPAENMAWNDVAGAEWQDSETEGLLSYVCKSCGGEIVGDKTTAATSCPFCGNPVVMMGQFSGSLKPDYRQVPCRSNASAEAVSGSLSSPTDGLRYQRLLRTSLYDVRR